MKKAAAELGKTLSKAMFKRDAVLNDNQDVEALRQAEEEYERSESEAKVKYEVDTTEALKLREKQKVTAKQEYEDAIADCEARYAPPHQVV